MDDKGIVLLPGERVLMKKGANAVITVDQSGLSKFAFDTWMFAVGMDPTFP